MYFSYFPDFTSYRYRLSFELPEVRNIGWLDKLHGFPTGDTPTSVIAKLKQIICALPTHANVHMNTIRGIVPCPICHEEKVEVPCDIVQSKQAHGVGHDAILGMGELLIPAGKIYFACPTLVFHYIEAHAYLPPQEFMDAVMNFDLAQPYEAQEVYDAMVARYDDSDDD